MRLERLQMRLNYCFMIPGLLIGTLIGTGHAAVGEKIPVAVSKSGPVVTIDASMVVPVTREQAWNVLTDYEHMAAFLPHLQKSEIIERRNNALRVMQSGEIPYGPLSFRFEYLRDVELSPYNKIRSRIIGGSLKAGEVTTQLQHQASGTLILYHSETVPQIWIPFGIGAAFIRDNIRDQLDKMRDEMLRRKGIEQD